MGYYLFHGFESRPLRHSLLRLAEALPALAILLALATGCVDRKLLLKSEPPGAKVLLDNEPKGVTPVELPFSYYGTRDLVLELDGYQTIHTLVEVDEPLYQIFPADFVTDVLVPATITDAREFTFILARVPERTFDSRDAERAIERGRELRERALESVGDEGEGGK